MSKRRGVGAAACELSPSGVLLHGDWDGQDARAIGERWALAMCPSDGAPIALAPFPLVLPDPAAALWSAMWLDTSTHPTYVAQRALSHWNAHQAAGRLRDRSAFLDVADWLINHAVACCSGAGVAWPISAAPHWHAPGPWISATTQGLGIAVLIRAHQITRERRYLEVARRAALTFSMDILDDGICAPVDGEGVVFEEVAVYPATHLLSGLLIGLVALLEYSASTGDTAASARVMHAHATLHTLLDGYDTGTWTRQDLAPGRLSSWAQLRICAGLLYALAQATHCACCAERASRWEMYAASGVKRMRAALHHWIDEAAATAATPLRRVLLGAASHITPEPPYLVAVPITAFPVAGGMRGVLAGVERAMADEWRMEYLTQHIGPNPRSLTIERLGERWGALASPWHAPTLWLYALSGWSKLLSLIRGGKRYGLLFPQDGTSTGAFSAVAGRMAGVRVVCLDHGNITLPHTSTYREERLAQIATHAPIRRPFDRLGLALYLKAQHTMARITRRYADFFLAAGDDVAMVYRTELGISPGRILRVPFMIDSERFAPLSPVDWVASRAWMGVPDDAIVITLVNRLAPEKDLDTALSAIRSAFDNLESDLRRRLRVLIVGEGPLRAHVEAEIRRLQLDAVCRLWGEATPDAVSHMLGASDIFLYTSTRGINPVSLLEAMAAGCACVATTAPQLVADRLADGRGIAVPVGDVAAVAEALVRIARDLPMGVKMGRRARAYVVSHNSAEALRRCLLRASYWHPRLALVSSQHQNATDRVRASADDVDLVDDTA